MHFCDNTNNVSEFCTLFTLFRTDALLLKLSLVMGQQVFYGALWGSMLVSPLVRLPASVFIVTHFDRMVSIRQQAYMLGHDQRLVVSFCMCLLTHSSKLSSVVSPIFLHLRPLFSSIWNSNNLFGFCLSSGEVTLAFFARLKCSCAKEHAWSLAILLPFCWIAGRCKQ